MTTLQRAGRSRRWYAGTATAAVAGATVVARSRGVRILFALLFIAGTTVSASVATQLPAMASTCTAQNYTNYDGAWYIPAVGCSSVDIPDSHVCAVVGTSADGATQGVECADIYTTWTSSNSAEIWGEGKYYCQGGHPQCLGMNVNIDFSVSNIDKDSAAVTAPLKNYKCTTGCPASGPAYVATQHVVVTPTNDCYQTYSWDPVGNVISINGASKASHSTKELDSGNVLICYGKP